MFQCAFLAIVFGIAVSGVGNALSAREDINLLWTTFTPRLVGQGVTVGLVGGIMRENGLRLSELNFASVA